MQPVFLGFCNLTSLKPFHTFHLDASAHSVTLISDKSDFLTLTGRKNGKDFVLLGEGSNCAFLEDYAGEVVLCEVFGKLVVETETSYLVTAKAGENWHEFVLWLLEHDIKGLENLALIPGTVGACPVQNIGAYGVEVESFIKQVVFYDLPLGVFRTFDNAQCEFAYRDSIFKQSMKQTALIYEVTFEFPKKWRPVLSYGELKQLGSPSALDIFHKVIDIRQSKLPDPNKVGNAGSFFKNPIVSMDLANRLSERYPDMPSYPVDSNNCKLAAGWLIDQCGLRGYCLDGVAVHDKQALVLVNKTGAGTSKGLIKLITKVIAEVKGRFDIQLVPEVRLYGREGEMSWSEIEALQSEKA